MNKSCDNCKHEDVSYRKHPCAICEYYEYWESAEEEPAAKDRQLLVPFPEEGWAVGNFINSVAVVLEHYHKEGVTCSMLAQGLELCKGKVEGLSSDA